MSRRFGYAILVLFAVSAVPGWVGVFAVVHQANANQAAQHREQLAQQREGQVIEQKLCASLTLLEPLAGLHAPAGNPATNPSRAYEQKLNKALRPLAQLGPDIECKGVTP